MTNTCEDSVLGTSRVFLPRKVKLTSAQKREQKVYVQVAYKLAEDSMVKREFGAVLDLRDHYPKYVVTMEDFWQDNIEGVKHKNLAEFLLMEEN